MSSLLHRIDDNLLLFALRSFLTNNKVGPRDYINLACASKRTHAFVDEHWHFLKPDMGTSHRARFVRKLEEYRRQRLEDDLPFFPQMDHMRQQVLLEVTTGQEEKWTPPPPPSPSSSTTSQQQQQQQHELRLAAYITILLPICAPGQVITSIRLSGLSTDTHVTIYNGRSLVFAGGDLLPLFGTTDGVLELMQFVRYLPPAMLLQLRVSRDVNAIVTVTNTTAAAGPERWWVCTYLDMIDDYDLVEARSIRISHLPFNGVAEYITFHLIDDDDTDATRTAAVVPSSFTLDFNGCPISTIPAWACRHTKKQFTNNNDDDTSESLRYYYRIPMDKQVDFSRIDSIRLYVHFDDPQRLARSGTIRFQVGALVYNILTQTGSFIEKVYGDL